MDTLECAGLAAVGMRLVFHHHQRHRRYQRTREEVRRQHRKDHRLSERHEQVARDTRQEEHGQKHDTDTQRRYQCRYCNLAGSVVDGVVQIFAKMEMTLDVLDRHCRIIDENTDCQRQSTQRHQVDRFAQRMQHDDGAENRQRYRHRNDARAAPITQEQKNQYRRQQRGDHGLMQHAVDCGTHEDRLIEHGRDVQSFRCAFHDLGNLGFYIVDNVQRRFGAILHHREQHTSLAVFLDDILLRLEAVTHMRDLAQIGGRTVHGLDRNLVHPFNGIWRAI